MLIGGFGQDPTLFKHGRDHVEEYIYVHTYTCIHHRSKSSKDSRRYENPVADVYAITLRPVDMILLLSSQWLWFYGFKTSGNAV